MNLLKEDIRALIIKEMKRLLEGDVVDMWRARGLPDEFGDDPTFSYRSRGRNLERFFPYISNDPERRDESILAIALAVRAEYLLDPDGTGEGIEIDVEPGMFSNEAARLSDALTAGEFDMEDEQVGVGYLVSRIDVDSFDEFIAEHLWSEYDVTTPGFEYIQEDMPVDWSDADKERVTAAGEEYEERIKDPVEIEKMLRDYGYSEESIQMWKTRSRESLEQPTSEQEEEFESHLQGIESGDIVEFPPEDE